MKLIADRLDRISPSLTIAMTAKARALKAAGRDVIGLSAGRAGFRHPAQHQGRRDRRHRARRDQVHRRRRHPRTAPGGLRRASRRDHGLDFKPEEILVATGGKQVIFDALLATIDPGDEAIIPAPCWVSYPDIVELAEGKPVIVAVRREPGLQDAARAAGSGDHADAPSGSS